MGTLGDAYDMESSAIAEQSRGDMPWQWCLAGNIVESHEYGEGHEIRVGTKQFGPGTKVYIAPAQWGDGYENVCVIGKPRRKRPLIEVVIKMDLIENFRLKKVFQPAVLKRMEKSPYSWWGSTDESRERILELIESIKRNREND